ncbi:unnamed protein product, partial [Ilex paraguariensis]
ADDIHLTQNEGIEAECCFGVKGERDRATVVKERRHEEGGELGKTFRHVMGGTLGQYFGDNFRYGKEMISISMGRETSDGGDCVRFGEREMTERLGKDWGRRDSVSVKWGDRKRHRVRGLLTN